MELPNTFQSASELDLENSACITRVCQDAGAAFERSQIRVKLIGVDAIGSSVGGGGNFARGVSTIVHHLERIRSETGATVLLLRHNSFGKRKNSTLPGAADVILTLTKAGEGRKLTVSTAEEPIFFSFKDVELQSKPGEFAPIVAPIDVQRLWNMSSECNTIH
jgi:hypothetical protein